MTRCNVQMSVAHFAGLGFLANVIPGLRSLRSLTRGYHLSPLRGWLRETSTFTLCRVSQFNKSLDARPNAKDEG